MSAAGKQSGGHYVGQVVKAVAARYESKMTEPPKRYTEDTLIADMLAAHKFASNEQDRAILKETEGLGTSRTRAATIEGLIQAGLLVSRKKKKLFELTSTEVARRMMSHLPDVLTSVATTAKWEVAFKMIERGQTQPEKVRAALAANLDHIVDVAKATGSLKMSGASPSDDKRRSEVQNRPKSGFQATSSMNGKRLGDDVGLTAATGSTSAGRSGGSRWFR